MAAVTDVFKYASTGIAFATQMKDYSTWLFSRLLAITVAVLVLLAIVAMPVLGSLLQGDVASAMANGLASVVSMVIVFLLGALALAILGIYFGISATRGSASFAAGKPMPFAEASKGAWKMAWPYVAASIIIGVISAVVNFIATAITGPLSLIVNLVVSVVFMMTFYALIVGNKGVLDAVRKSYEMFLRNPATLFVTMIATAVAALIAFVVVAIIAIILGLLMASVASSSLIAAGVIAAIIGLVIIAAIALVTVMTMGIDAAAYVALDKEGGSKPAAKPTAKPAARKGKR
ncbi:MAG: hypothetical protein AABW54_04385 [Candidatus Micrarchaeota archaeon]